MWARLAARIRAFWYRRDIRRSIDEELAFHVDMERAAHEAGGDSAADARQQALADFGGTTQVRAEILEARTTRLVRVLDRLRQDVRYAGRTFARTPLAMASVVIVLACAIGLNTAVFSAVDAIFYAPLPVPNPSAVLLVSGPATKTIDYGVFRDRAHGAVLGVSPTHWGPFSLTSAVVHLFGKGELVDASYFQTLDLKPQLGRFFRPSDDDPLNVDRAVVLSDLLWRTRWHADPAVIGQHVALDGTDSTIVGVAPRGFRGISLPWQPTEFWAIFAQQMQGVKPSNLASAFVARLAPNVSAASVASMVVDRPGQPNPSPGHTTFLIRPASGLLAPADISDGLGYVRALADAIAAMALIVMLIAATNVVGILLARGLARSSELAIRQAIGATGRRLVAQLLTESVLLGGAAGGAGLLVAELFLAIYRGASPADTALEISIDLRALVYTLVVCSVAGLVVGLAPARQALRLNVLAALSAPGAGTKRAVGRRVRYGALAPQLGLSVALLVIAGAHARTLYDLEGRPAGYRVDHVLTVDLQPPARTTARSTDADRTAADNADRVFSTTFMAKIGALPGVSAVALTAALPARTGLLGRPTWICRDRLDGAPPRFVAAGRGLVSADFFRVFDMRLLAGRPFDDTRDSLNSPPVAIVSASLARELAPDGNVIGRLITLANRPDQPARLAANESNPATAWSEIIGVVGDTTDGASVVPLVYHDVGQLPDREWNLNVVAQVSTDPASAALAMRHTIVEIDPNAALTEVEQLSDLIARDHYPRRLALGLVAFAAGFGMFLASVGLYSAVSYWTAQQARELGIRAALGATRHDLIGIVLWNGARVVLTALVPGLLLGLLGFRLTARLIAYVIGPVTAPGLDVIAAVIAVVAAVTALACYVPARRAAKADPLRVLRA